MKKINVPFNIDLLILSDQDTRTLKPVTSLDIFTSGSGSDFHEEGLFSTSIFGKVADERRQFRFSYIDFKVEVFHPVIFKSLIESKRLYSEIVSGVTFARWDEKLSDFVKSNPSDGDTGFNFFVSKWKNIVLPKATTTSRMQDNALITKYKDKCMISKLVVMPAGLRELEIDDYNRIKEDEINSDYRRILSLSNTISDTAVKNNPEALDKVRYQLQLAVNVIYDKVRNIIEGKKKLLLGSFASRRVFNGTRNVITSMDTRVAVLGEAGGVGFNDTIIGLYQYLKAVEPIAVYQIKKFVSNIFADINHPVKLVNTKTLEGEDTMIGVKYFDQWTTSEGIKKILTIFKEESIRNKPLIVDGKYLALIYKGPDMTYKVFSGIQEFPEGLDKKYVKPITLCELLYLSVYKESSKYPLYLTRYPVTGIGSIYPSNVFLKPTLETEKRVMLGEDWKPDENNVAYQFPVLSSAFVNSMIPHPTRLARLGADFDGDTGSANIAYSDESIAEWEAFKNSKKAYIGTDGKFIHKTGTSTVELVLYNMTGD